MCGAWLSKIDCLAMLIPWQINVCTDHSDCLKSWGMFMFCDPVFIIWFRLRVLPRVTVWSHGYHAVKKKWGLGRDQYRSLGCAWLQLLLLKVAHPVIKFKEAITFSQFEQTHFTMCLLKQLSSSIIEFQQCTQS